ncbi:sulfiredoxin, chloroplastic/mitochondrial [Selaginella moellendorffii]|nr:sulfiredoxin, chloroplastic/mitochondrial [Selaginella moellendorffii]XP_002975756.2 sulfiredoxin, chloroplastic/mitochondrial [Selaginella moellendorffii]XP_024534429.1 sulfiredoxin, chloroplastic/mitochondrial [Selaginella moellendorffii]|eukprot:XP_002973705.2 sulfiredoxin, chloroplastic/mitochondrial [Selaginella moellendorffii]
MRVALGTIIAPLPLRPCAGRVRCATEASENGSLVGKRRGPIVADIPLEQIRRPLLRTRSNDPDKVKSLMDSIAEIGLQEPIDVLEVDGQYYGFSGCHRFEAHQKLGLPTIRCKIRRATKETLRHHLR